MNKSTYLEGQAKFRLKKWTNLKPVPTGDGRSFVVPRFESPGVVIPVSDFKEMDDMLSTPAPTSKRPDHEEGKVRASRSGLAADEVDALTSEEILANGGRARSKSPRSEAWAPARAFPVLDTMLSTPISETATNGANKPTDEQPPEQVLSQTIGAVPAVGADLTDEALGDEAFYQSYFERAEENTDE